MNPLSQTIDREQMWNPQVLFEDNHVLVVFKPFGVPTQGDKTGDPSLLDFCRDYLREKYAKPGNIYLGLVHRLDRPVAGLVVVAKTSKAAARLSEQFRERRVTKTYWAWVEGWPRLQDHLVHYLTSGPNNRVESSEIEVADSQRAELKYRVLGRGRRESLLEVELLTGRKHQIRAQLSAIGYPILGDAKYDGRKWIRSKRGIALLGCELAFEHPVSGENQHFQLQPDWFRTFYSLEDAP